MKRSLKILLLIFILILFTGCGSDISCKKKYNDNIKYKVVIDADVVNGKIASSKATIKFENENDAKEICNLNKILNNENVLISCVSKKVVINGFHYLEMDKNANSISKEKFRKNLISQGYSC